MEPQEFEIYDLRADPKETQNLYGRPEYASLQKHLLERLEALAATIPARKAPLPPHDPKIIHQLPNYFLPDEGASY